MAILVLPQSDKDGYDCHGSTRKNTEKSILWYLFFRVFPWLLNKFGVQLKMVQHTLLSG
jgi:hypothetical protein